MNRPAFRLTIRHLMILIVFAAILCATYVSTTHGKPIKSARLLLSPFGATLLFSPMILALLLVLFERRSPFKYWLVIFCFAGLMGPVWFCLLLWLNHESRRAGLAEIPWGFYVFCIFLFMCLMIFIPISCPGCKRRSLVMLLLLFDRPNDQKHYCLRCRKIFRRLSRKVWEEVHDHKSINPDTPP